MRGFFTASLIGSALAALFSLCLFLSTAQAEVAFEKTSLTVEAREGRRLNLTIELALDDEQRMQGLMQRKFMPQDHGMLFDFGETRLVTMWMKNTILPLDMLFMDEKGIVVHIRQDAVPFSEELISSGGPVRYVLELNAGATRHFGLAVGDRANLPLPKR